MCVRCLRLLASSCTGVDHKDSKLKVFGLLQTEVENVRPSDEDLRVVCEKMVGGGNQKMSAVTL